MIYHQHFIYRSFVFEVGRLRHRYTIWIQIQYITGDLQNFKDRDNVSLLSREAASFDSLCDYL